jgi:hypothetical protein
MKRKSPINDPTLGPTGNFPDGKLTVGDEGQVKLAIGTNDGNVIVDFGVPTKWIGMSPEDALYMAQLLIQHALSLDPSLGTTQVEETGHAH